MDLHSKVIVLRESSWLSVLSGVTSTIGWSPFLLLGAWLLGGLYAALAMLVAVVATASWCRYRHVKAQQQIRNALQAADRSFDNAVAGP